MLWELSVTEQRYRAVLEVMAGVPVTEVAERYGVSGEESTPAYRPGVVTVTLVSTAMSGSALRSRLGRVRQPRARVLCAPETWAAFAVKVKQGGLKGQH